VSSRWSRAAFAASFAGALLSCSRGPQASSSVAPDAQSHGPIRFIGRSDLTDPEHPRFSWPASAIATRFTGASLHVRLKDTGYDELEVVVDGAPVGVIATNPLKDDYQVVTGLADGPHELFLSKRTEARIGEVSFLGFEPGAKLAPPTHMSTRRVELVGDSITAGYGAEGPGPTCTGSMAALENEFLAYGAIAARSLLADHVTIAWSGRTTEEMSTLYDRTIATQAASRWDFARWTPDAIVVNLGTNDFNRGDPGQGAFVKPYLAFVQRLRTLYPSALIVCALGPMLTDNYPPGGHALTRARLYITQVVAQVRAAGEKRIVFVEFPSQDFANGLGCDYHPSLKTHRMMGDQLAATLRAELKW
jgi:lysophospholipase L1-like esterase